MDLLRRIADGEWSAYTELVSFYSPKLLYFLLPLTNNDHHRAEDILQDVFLAVWEKRGSLPVIRSVDQYLFRMTKNRFLDLVRKENSRQKLVDDYKDVQASMADSPHEQVVYAEYREQAARAIEQLSPKLRSVFLLSTQQELSLDEIAEALQLPKDTVKKRLYLAGNAIRNYLKKYGEWFVLFFLYFF